MVIILDQLNKQHKMIN